MGRLTRRAIGPFALILSLAPAIAAEPDPADPPPRPRRRPTARTEYETVVTAPPVRQEVARRVLSRDEVTHTPGTMGDPFRVIETLPGVVPIATGVPYYYVRGAPPADTGTFLDGLRIPALFHLALGPSVIHPALVERVDFWPGAKHTTRPSRSQYGKNGSQRTPRFNVSF